MFLISADKTVVQSGCRHFEEEVRNERLISDGPLNFDDPIPSNSSTGWVGWIDDDAEGSYATSRHATW